MNTYRVNNAGLGADGLLSTNVEGVKVHLPVTFLGHGDISQFTSVQSIVQSTEGQLGATGSELHGEDRLAGLAGGDEALENGRSIVLANALETHSHETIGREVGAGEAVAVLGGGT